MHLFWTDAVERRLSERQSSEPAFSSFYVQTTNKSAITSRNKVLCHFY